MPFQRTCQDIRIPMPDGFAGQKGVLKMKYAWIAMLGWMLSGVVMGSTSTSEVRASMMVSGSIAVSAKGRVIGYTLDQKDKLPASVTQLLARNISRWRFEPVLRHGSPVSAKARMYLRITARPQGKNRYALSISGTRFGSNDSNRSVRYNGRPKAPFYPILERQDRVSGTVYLVIRVNRLGRVDKIATEQVDLYTRGPYMLMKRWRDDLATSAEKTASQWTFKLPTQGKDADKTHWTVKTPVTFSIARYARHLKAYGHWHLYIPGPRNFIPWVDATQLANGDGDAMPVDGLYSSQQALHRINQPQS